MSLLETRTPIAEQGEKQGSNLSPELQTFVRTPGFKEWFGDWENDPENASKVVDENGEPALVYFGGPAGIQRLSGDKRNRTGSDETGYYFTTRQRSARFYAHNVTDPITDERLPSSVYGAFLDIKNPYVKQVGDGVRTERVTEKPEGYDGYIAHGGAYEIVVYSPEQVAFVQEEAVNTSEQNPDRGVVYRLPTEFGTEMSPTGDAGQAVARVSGSVAVEKVILPPNL